MLLTFTLTNVVDNPIRHTTQTTSIFGDGCRRSYLYTANIQLTIHLGGIRCLTFKVKIAIDFISWLFLWFTQKMDGENLITEDGYCGDKHFLFFRTAFWQETGRLYKIIISYIFMLYKGTLHLLHKGIYAVLTNFDHALCRIYWPIFIENYLTFWWTGEQYIHKFLCCHSHLYIFIQSHTLSYASQSLVSFIQFIQTEHQFIKMKHK